MSTTTDSWPGTPATELAAAVREGRASAAEVVGAHLDRIAALDSEVGAFVHVRDEQAREEAAALDAREDLASLPLAGVPVGIKDVVAVAGLPTGHGSRALRAAPAEGDDVLVARLRAAGAVVVGVTRCPELSVFASSDDPAGAARNPWDPTRVTGGSSGGSGAAVATSMVPVALASDGLGSIRIPAAANGLVGIKPGSGVVPVGMGTRDEHWFGMSQFGPVATTVDDAALFLDVLAGDERFRGPAVPDRALRIAVSTASPALGVRVGTEQQDAVHRLAGALAGAGHQVVDADPPYDNRATLDILTRWTIGTMRDADDLGADLTALQRRTATHVAIGRALRRVRDVDPAQAARWQAKVDAFLGGYDLLLTPAMTSPPTRGHGWWDRSWAANVRQGLQWVPFQSPWNLADLPAASVPAGLDRLRLPLSVQVVAPRGQEDLLVAALRQLESLAPWPRTPAHA